MSPVLPRRLGWGGALLISFNGAVGASLFALPAQLADEVGAFAPWLFPAIGLAALLIALPFARAAALFPVNGGPAVYGAVFGRFAGFQLGWLYYISRCAAFAANLNVLADYLLRWAGADLPAGLRAGAMLAVVAVLTLANAAGVRGAIRLLGGLTLLKTLPVIAVAGLALATAPLPPLPAPPPLNAFEASALLVFYAFIGFEASAVTAGETRDAGRSVPRALVGTILAIALFYFAVQLAFAAVAPTILPTEERAPLLALGRELLGPAGALLITVAAVSSLAGNLHGNLAATPRVTHRLAEQGDLPAWLARVHPRAETPHLSILFMGALAGLLAVSGGFVWLAVVSTLARLLIYAVTIAAGWRVQRPAPTAAAGGTVAILLCALLAAQASGAAWLTLVLLAAAGALLFGLAKLRG